MQLAARLDALEAGVRALPFRFEGVAGEGLAGGAGVPANGRPFIATGTVPTDR